MITYVKNKLKKIQFFYFTIKKIQSKDYQKARIEFKNSRAKSKEMITKEINVIREYWKCDPMHYYRYRLFDKDLTEEELLDYVPPYFFYNYYLHSIYEGLDVSLFESKIKLDKLFKEKKIESPTVLAVMKNGELWVNDRVVSPEKFLKTLSRSSAKVFFVKPDKGKGGSGIETIEKFNNQLIFKGKVLNSHLLKVLGKTGNFIVQEGITQHKDFSAINSSSVNTLRIVTQLNENSFRMPVAILRIGRGDSKVDNSAKGGISVKIDTKSGELSKYGYVEHGTEVLEYHPDSGFKFENFQIKTWNNIVESIKRYAESIPELKEVAWDIALGDDYQVLVIEINTNYGIDHVQCTVGGVRRLMNIEPIKFK